MKSRTLLFLVILLTASIILRLQHIPTMWNGDIARDYLVAYHIFKYKEYPLVGHFSSGINFYYPPYYFYALSLLLYFSTNYFFILTIFSLFNAFSTLTIFLIGKFWCNTKVGLIAATFYSLSMSMIYMSGNTWSAHIIVPIFLLSLLFFTVYLKSSKFMFLIFSLLTLLLGSFLHIVLLFYILLFLFLSILTKKIPLLVAVLIGVIILCLYLIANIPVFHQFGIPNTLAAYSPTQNIRFSTDIITRIFTNIKSLFLLGYNYHTEVVVINSVLLIAFVISIAIKRINALKQLWYPMVILLMLPTFAAIKEGIVYRHYFTTSVPLLFLIYGYLIYVITNLSRYKVVWYIFFFASLFLVFFSSRDPNGLYRYKSEYKIFSDISEYINSGSGSYNFDVVAVDNYAIIPSYPAIFYFLEKTTGIKLLSVTNDGNNLRVVRPIQLVYLICLPVYSEDWDYEPCINKFIKSYPSYSQADISKIYSSYSSNYRVIKYTKL